MTPEEIDACTDAWREVTTATDDDVARAAARLDAWERPAGYDPADLEDHPRPTRGAESRVRERLRAESQPPPAPWGWSAGMAAAMTTAALLLLSIGGPPQSDPWDDVPDVAEVPEPVGLDAVLTEGLSELQASEHVALTVEGDGVLSGDTDSPRIAWQGGTLGVDVTPGQGIDLRVATDEGEIAVLGTAFTVDRDPRRGTTVTVEHGHVRVSCRGVDPVDLLDAGELLCPSRAALLGDARKAAGSDDFAAVMAAADRGLRMGDVDALGGELLFVRLEARVASGDASGARADAEAYLAAGGPRATTVEEILAGLE